MSAVILPLIRVLLLGLLLPLSAMAGSLLSNPRAEQLLSNDQAFALLPIERSAQQLHLSWNIAPGYYLYRQRIRVEVLAPAKLKAGALQLRRGDAHHDEHFGDVEIYRGLLQANLPVQGMRHNSLRVRVSFQGCADLGVCYPPQSVEQTILP